MPKIADLLGIVGSTFTIGSRSLADGVRRLAFRSGTSLGAIDWTITANRTITLPDATGTILLNTTTVPIAGASVNPVGVSVVDFSIPAGVRRLTLLSNSMIAIGAIVRLGTSSGVVTTGYNCISHYIGTSTGSSTITVGITVPKCGVESTASFCMTFYRMSPNAWISTGQSRDNADFGAIIIGNILLPGELTTFSYISPTTIASGSLQLLWEF